MQKDELQEMIEKTDRSSERMRKIGEAYISGDVLYDPVAAEAWLMLAIEQGESEDAVRAMELIAREIHGQEKVLSDEDYIEICREWKNAGQGRRKYLERLLQLGTEEQVSMWNDSVDR